MHRRILHLDVDAFLASVEIARDPSLEGRPVVIGAGPEDTRTRNIVMSSSYAAREFGVRPGIHLGEARRLCPHAVFLMMKPGPPNPSLKASFFAPTRGAAACRGQ